MKVGDFLLKNHIISGPLNATYGRGLANTILQELNNLKVPIEYMD